MSLLPWIPMWDTDPVCGARVDTGRTVLKIAYGKVTFYFCSEACMQSFVANPAKYVR